MPLLTVAQPDRNGRLSEFDLMAILNENHVDCFVCALLQ